MGVCLMILALLCICVCASLAVFTFIELSAMTESNITDVNLPSCKKTLLTAGLYVFGILAGIVLFFTGLFLCF